MLFVDFSLAFDTISPLNMTATLCSWIINILIHRLQTFWICNHLLRSSAQHRSTSWLCTRPLPFFFTPCTHDCGLLSNHTEISYQGENPQSCVGGSQRANYCSMSAKLLLLTFTEEQQKVILSGNITNWQTGCVRRVFVAVRLNKSGEWFPLP